MVSIIFYCSLLEQCSPRFIGIYCRLIQVFFYLQFCWVCASTEDISMWVLIILVSPISKGHFAFREVLVWPMWSAVIAFQSY